MSGLIRHYPDGFPGRDGPEIPPEPQRHTPHHVYSVTYGPGGVLVRTTDRYAIKLPVKAACAALGIRADVHPLGDKVLWMPADAARALAEGLDA